MEKDQRIYVAGHTGLVGSAICRALQKQNYQNVVVRTHADCDLTNPTAAAALFRNEQPDYVFLAAAKVGGIYANRTYPADFMRENIAIQNNVIHEAWRSGVKRLLFLGSSCMYPREAPQPIKEEYLLTGPLEATTRAYALAKIAGLEMCWDYNRQYKTSFLCVMPCNIYGPAENFHPENSHVVAGLIRRFHEAKINGLPSVSVWGTGSPRRELLYSEDMADACLFLMNLKEDFFGGLVKADGAVTNSLPPLINVGVGEDLTIHELATIIRDIVGYNGGIVFDRSKPDGTKRKLMDISKLSSMGWRAQTDLRSGLISEYEAFLRYLAEKV